MYQKLSRGMKSIFKRHIANSGKNIHFYEIKQYIETDSDEPEFETMR